MTSADIAERDPNDESDLDDDGWDDGDTPENPDCEGEYDDA